MNTESSVATPFGIDHASTSARRWPQFSRQEVRRLEFLVYRRQTGRLHPAAPVHGEVDTLCATLLDRPAQRASSAAAHQDPERAPVRIPPWRSIRGGIPLTWAVYAELYGTRRPGDVDRQRWGRQ
jgi:hypothetical protein